MAQIRQEINIIDAVYAATTTTVDCNERIQIDTTQYNGTVTYYIEVLATNSTGSGRAVGLRTSGGEIVSLSIAASTATMTLFRGSFTPTAGAVEYFIRLNSNIAGTLTVKSARIIIIQNATTITNTETQIELGGGANTTSTTNLGEGYYWKYTAANWDGTKTFYFEGTFLSNTSKSAATMTLQTSTDILAPSWSDVASSAVTTTATVATRVRSGAITLVDGNWYRTAFKAGNSKSGVVTYSSKIIIDSNSVAAQTQSNSQVNLQGGTAGAGQDQQRVAQQFTLSTTATITGVSLLLLKAGSPTDTINIDIVSTLDGSSLANATQSCSALTTTKSLYSFTFGTPVSLTGGTPYYIQLSRTPDTYDATNKPLVGRVASLASGGLEYLKSNGSYTNITTENLYFVLAGVSASDSLTKLEPQYLLANTVFAAGTSAQNFLTKWDSAEWDAGGGGSIGYYFQAEAGNGSTSDVVLIDSGGTTVTNSTLTNIDNAQISPVMTMPSNGNLDVKATTNAGDIVAARILVYYVFVAAAARTPRSPGSIGHPFMV